ncbi:MAG: hypothetical protein ACJAWV_001017 [Flammeovirgaceae bacterium]
MSNNRNFSEEPILAKKTIMPSISQREIQHLYWRAEFGLSVSELGKTPKNRKSALDELFKRAKKITPLPKPKMPLPSWESVKKMSPKKKNELRKKGVGEARDLNEAWVKQMASANLGTLREKMALFWHGHFACKLENPFLAQNQINLLKKHALGSFREMLSGIAKDGAMILYLNNQQNRKGKPNENFTRELMELFTVGRGNYTENDIKEGAKAFTGWSANRINGDFMFRKRQHDFGSKNFMGKTGNFDGQDIIDIILAKRETATFISRKLYKYFVNEIQPNEKHIEELTDVFFKSDYDIGKTMRFLFDQDWFYETVNIGSKIKSPIEFLAGLMRKLELNFQEEKGILFTEKALGQILFFPPNVAGWPSGKTWIDNATLLIRLNYPSYIFSNTEIEINLKNPPETKPVRVGKKMEVTANLKPLMNAFKKTNADRLGEEMAAFFLQVPVQMKDSAFEKFSANAKAQDDRIKTWAISLMSLPEYQLC